MTSALNQPHFQDATKGREYLESIRWPNGPVCPHCRSVSRDHYVLNGKAQRPGVYKCKDCREQFTVTVGTVFERSKVPLHQWMQAVYLICSSKKGCSSHQLQRTLAVQYKMAWFMSHRIREAMNCPGGYTAEFDFRCNHRQKLRFTDEDRTVVALKRVGGKRLTYRRI